LSDPVSLTVSVIRPEDLLHLTYNFINLTVRTKRSPPGRYLRRINVKKPAFIIVNFPPQYIAEEAFFINDATYPLNPGDPDFGTTVPDKLPSGPVSSLITGSTRLVFSIPDEIRAIPYTLDSLLDWTKYSLVVKQSALPPTLARLKVVDSAISEALQNSLETILTSIDSTLELSNNEKLKEITAEHLHTVPDNLEIFRNPDALRAASPSKPDPTQTAIEAPYRLILSPNKFAGWAHSRSPVSQKTDRIELWHTRLGIRLEGDGAVDEKQDYYRTLRAIWSDDYSADILPEHFPSDPMPFRMSLDKRDRCELVSLTANPLDNNWEARVIRANQLMLSALGICMKVRYSANIPDNSKLTVQEWHHEATLSRDQYVRVVYKGYLLPFGNGASLVKVTERKFKKTENGESIAYLFQRMYIVVRQPEKHYPGFGQQHDGKLMPFKRIRIMTVVTPDLARPEDSEIIDGLAQSAFWPRIRETGKDFLFKVVGEDTDGQQAEFTIPLIFVDNTVAHNNDRMKNIITNYNYSTLNRRKCPLLGQKIAFAQSSNNSRGDTTYETVSLTFAAEAPSDAVLVSASDRKKFAKQDQPLCYPSMEQAEIEILAVKQISKQTQPTKIAFHPSYYANENGFQGTNKAAEVFAKVVDDAVLPVKFEASKAGGVVTPNFNMVGISRRFGPLGGNPAKDSITKLAEGSFNSEDFFSGINASLLGGIDLASIITNGFGPNGGDNIPRLTTKLKYPDDDKSKSPKEIETKFSWKPFPLISKGSFKPHDNATLLTNSVLTSALDGSGVSTFRISGELTNFDIDLFGFIVVSLDEIKFQAMTGKSIDIAPKIKEVKFGGPLEFVNELKDYLAVGGKGGFSVDTDIDGVKTGFDLAIPTIGVGVVTIQNIAFTAGLNLPFDGDPVRFRFAFCEREHPFLLTVYGMGGGGFFGLALGLDGVETLEASFEFGASVALDIGVASGEVHVLAGIYYKWQDKDGEGLALLSGFLRMGGELEVLGIVSISVEFYLSLSYESGSIGPPSVPSKVWGEAALTVKIKVALFSKTVTMSVRREFSDPERITFAQRMTQEMWEGEGGYCDAFAVLNP
jgi:hypothetical protein